MIPTFAAAPGLAQLRAIAAEALAEHANEREMKDEPAAITALFDALASVREMLRHTRQHSELWQAAMDVVNQVLAAAAATHGKVYGCYERRYRRVRLAAIGLQITIADRTATAREREQRHAQPDPPTTEAAQTTPAAPVTPPANPRPAAQPHFAHNRPAAAPFNQTPRPNYAPGAPPAHPPGPRRIWM